MTEVMIIERVYKVCYIDGSLWERKELPVKIIVIWREIGKYRYKSNKVYWNKRKNGFWNLRIISVYSTKFKKFWMIGCLIE